MKNLQIYLSNLNEIFKSGNSTEHSFRASLQNFLQNISNIKTINEPRRQQCGAPDLILLKNNIPFGYIETKDIIFDLDKFENDEQLTRYKKSLNNLILTNYIEFRFFRNGIKTETIKIASIINEKIKPIPENFDKFFILLNNFLNYQCQSVKSAKELSSIMANKAVLMRDILENILKDSENNTLKEQMSAFKTFLSDTLDEKSFADMYAQTITYGLFVARLNDKTQADFSRQEARDLVSKSNPFLRGLFDYISGANLEDRIAWLVDDLVEIFKNSDVKTIMATFGHTEGLKDPFLHFYETFLTAYDKETRQKRGVYYTPEPVVKFIVRAVDNILQKEFKLPKGLADDTLIKHTDKDINAKKGFKVQILDPATGTGTFLAETLKLVFEKFKNQLGMWQSYAKTSLIPRLNGFEILMTPYVMCHLKLEIVLNDTFKQAGANLTNDCRFNVYLTNSLEDNEINTLPLFDGLTEEIRSAKKVKNEKPIMVVMGNPPYSISSCNKNDFINGLLEIYKQKLNERNIQPLSDDYIKFIRLGEYFVEKNKEGILAYITNNSFLDGLIHRQMRYHLLETFDKIYVLNLHGNSKRKETCPDGSKDENVFNIMTGVSINLFVKTGKKKKNTLADIFYADLYGLRNDKFSYLEKTILDQICFTKLNLHEPYYFFVPKDFSTESYYNQGFKIDELFIKFDSGIKTSKDNVNVQSTREDIEKLKDDILTLSEEAFRLKYNVGPDTRDWSVSRAKQDILDNIQTAQICQYAYRPFNAKFIIFTGKTNGLMARPRARSMKNIIVRDNSSLVLMRSSVNTPIYNTVFIANAPIDINFYGFQSYFFPLYLYNDEVSTREPNFNMEIIREIEQKIGLTFTKEDENNNLTFAPIDVLDYIYGVLHSNKYRKKYNEFLKIDFPRVPYPKNKEYFRKIASLGAKLRQIHLLEGKTFDKFITGFNIVGSNIVKDVYFEQNRVYINDTQYFDNVPQVAWDFFIGGHQPAQKWLKDRKGKTLTYDDLQHYQKIILALTKTSEIMKEIDEFFD